MSLPGTRPGPNHDMNSGLKCTGSLALICIFLHGSGAITYGP